MANEEYLPPDSEASAEIVEVQPSALAVITQSEYAAMVATANQPANKRKIDVFSKQLMSYATHSQAVALSMFYTLPRAGKQIVGPGVRFAEVVAPCWRNNSTGSRMMGSTENTITAQGVFIDYEFNNRNIKEIPRRITNNQGQKFNDDMILTTGKAALSIAYREAVLKGGVPMALWDPAYQQAKLAAVGQAISHSQRIDAAMEYLNKLGVTEWQILNSVGVSSPKELETDHLVTLKTLCEEIKKGQRTIEEVFGSPFDKEIEALFTQLGKNETQKRLLKESYMGRAKDLLEYLRGQVSGSNTQGTKVASKEAAKPDAQAKTEEKKPEPSTEQAKSASTTEEKQAEGGKRRGRPTKEEVAAREAAARAEAEPQTTQATQETQAEEKPAAQSEEFTFE